jgi:hypothetical protein
MILLSFFTIMFKHRFLLIMGSIVDIVLFGSIEINSLMLWVGGVDWGCDSG